jgi:hypothetical protein
MRTAPDEEKTGQDAPSERLSPRARLDEQLGEHGGCQSEIEPDHPSYLNPLKETYMSHQIMASVRGSATAAVMAYIQAGRKIANTIKPTNSARQRVALRAGFFSSFTASVRGIVTAF